MKIKARFLILSIIIISIIGVITFGFYTMDIEDHYGDLQEIFYEVKSGDIILSRPTQEVGILNKNFTRMNVINVKNESKDLYNWVYVNGKQKQIEIYRPKEQINSDELDYLDITNSVEYLNWKLIIKN
jgi:hypothetical protein